MPYSKIFHLSTTVFLLVLLTACGKHESSGSSFVRPQNEIFEGTKNAIDEAITADDPKALGAILAGGVDVNSTLEGGQTLLIKAAVNGSVRVVHLLLRKGADVKRTDAEGKTARERASEKGVQRVLVLLDPTEQEKVRAELVALINEPGRNITATLNKGADPNFIDTQNNGESPLTLAIEKGNERAAKILAKWRDSFEVTNIDVNFANQGGMRPLAKARVKNLSAIVSLLESLGAKE
jgi:ankyrin repeat protein